MGGERLRLSVFELFLEFKCLRVCFVWFGLLQPVYLELSERPVRRIGIHCDSYHGGNSALLFTFYGHRYLSIDILKYSAGHSHNLALWLSGQLHRHSGFKFRIC